MSDFIIDSLEDFKTSFSILKEKGWIRSERRGATGIGHTIEKHLGLHENNFSLPDYGNVELKSHRINSPSMITLFTFNRKVWRKKPLDAIRDYGTPDPNGRLGLYFTMSQQPNSAGLFIDIDSVNVSVRHKNGELIAEWNLNKLAERFMKKLPALIFVSAFCEMRGDIEWFKYERAQLLTGTSANIINNQFRSGNILIDLRLHNKGTSARNHGTGFRVFEDKLHLLFESIREL